MEQYERKPTKTVYIGAVPVGGGHPVSLQSMCNTRTEDVPSTLAQLTALKEEGADIGRLAVPDREAAQALPMLVQHSPLPLVADIHFDFRLALAAIRAGIAGLRVNPGNIGSADRLRQVAAAAKDAGIAIRVGVNGGSLEKDIQAKYGGATAEALCESALRQAELLEDMGFSAIKLSLKSSHLPTMLAANRMVSRLCDYPLHIGVTETGRPGRGSLKSAIGIGALLSEGIGDTLRVSLTADPLEEVRLARDILSVLGLRAGGWELVSCPTCGRTSLDIIDFTRRLEEALADIVPPRPCKVAVMGCAVNGPGEAADADIGVAGGVGGGLIFAHGKSIGFFEESVLFDEFIAQIKRLTIENS